MYVNDKLINTFKLMNSEEHFRYIYTYRFPYDVCNSSCFK